MWSDRSYGMETGRIKSTRNTVKYTYFSRVNERKHIIYSNAKTKKRNVTIFTAVYKKCKNGRINNNFEDDKYYKRTFEH